MGDCGCKGGTPVAPTANAISTANPNIVPNPKIEGAITKVTCPKCSYWMSLKITPATKEKTFICQNLMCKHSMPYSQQSRSRSAPLPL